MGRRAARYRAILLVGILLWGCAREERAPPPAPSVQRRPPPAPAPGPASSAAGFIAASGSIDLFIIRSSELALERSASRRVRDYASRAIEVHKGTSAQLSLAGRRLNLLPSSVMRPDEQAMFDALASALDFDAAYVRTQRLALKKALAVDQAYAAGGDSPTLRPVAAAAIQAIQRDLSLLTYL